MISGRSAAVLMYKALSFMQAPKLVCFFVIRTNIKIK